MRFELGMKLNINDECVGTITKMTEERIYIKSTSLSGWATKAEIAAAIRSARPVQSRRKRARSLASAEQCLLGQTRDCA
jgi:hypothetical protein